MKLVDKLIDELTNYAANLQDEAIIAESLKDTLEEIEEDTKTIFVTDNMNKGRIEWLIDKMEKIEKLDEDMEQVNSDARNLDEKLEEAKRKRKAKGGY